MLWSRYSYKQEGPELKKSVLSFANCGATSLFTTANDLLKWLDNYRTMRVGGPPHSRTEPTLRCQLSGHRVCRGGGGWVDDDERRAHLRRGD